MVPAAPFFHCAIGEAGSSTLPMLPGPPGIVGVVLEGASVVAPLPPTILYVDDDELSRLALRTILGRAGFRVTEAATGRDALRLANDHPDLVLLDVNLPDIDGFEVCRQIKAHPATHRIPVLHLSAMYVTSEDRTHGLEGGADGYLTKPVEPQELIAHLRAMLRIRQAEEETRAVARQWQATFDAMSDGVALLNREGQVLRCNRALERLTGRPAAHIVGRPWLDMLTGLPGLDGAVFRRMLATGRRESAEGPVGGRWLQIVVDPIWDQANGLTGAVYILSDVTEHWRLEEQLRQAQKLQAVGQLAGGIAHDFNNLLAAILGNVSLLLEGGPHLPPKTELLRTVEKAALRAADLTRQLLGFSRQNILWLKPLDLQEAVDEVLKILHRTIDPRITVEVRSGPDLGRVRADANQVNQVLLNLCLNARDAMPEGGRLLLETQNATLDADAARRHVDAAAGEFVRLRVQDTGHGIPEEIRSRIFEPFFTTKEPGQGTGLGLAMVFGIVKQHHGWVECTSVVGQGTTFDVYLPRCTDEPPAPPARARNPGPTTGTETILLVDDEAMVRDLGRLILRNAGYRVHLAEDGRQAVDLYRREHPHIDLVILDLTMPHLSGRDTLRELMAINSRARVLLTSGYSAEEKLPAGLAGVMGFLPKPYRQDELLHTVRAVLDQPAAPRPPEPAE
jgi:two-component system, cell cycle sensor histidine kinase and response regulator CckA